MATLDEIRGILDFYASDGDFDPESNQQILIDFLQSPSNVSSLQQDEQYWNVAVDFQRQRAEQVEGNSLINVTRLSKFEDGRLPTITFTDGEQTIWERHQNGGIVYENNAGLSEEAAKAAVDAIRASGHLYKLGA